MLVFYSLKIYGMLLSLGASGSLSYVFNLGSFLGMAIAGQIVSGLLLVLNYSTSNSFDSVMFIVNETPGGWLIKLFHSNNASVIFLALYLHLYKNLIYFSYRLMSVWNSGIVMMLLLMGAGFSGYVLVGSQMSYWAAMVITSLISVLPVVGEGLMYWVWGGYSISWVTISLMFVAHFLLPFVVLFMLGFHLLMLHNSGSTSLVFSHSGVSKVTFYPYYWIKDAMNVSVYMLLVVLMLLYPYSLGEVELFEEANTLVSPSHIVPEWYFCSQYAMLRSVPSKGAGVMIMIFSVVVYFLYPTSISSITPASGVNMAAVVSLVCVQVMLTYLGFAPIEQPFVFLSLIFTLLYFLIHVLVMSVNLLADYYFDVSSGNTMEEGTKETLVVEETAESLLGLHALARDFPLQ